MEYLLTQRSHPTVDEIYNVLVKEIPTLSKTTVYNSLKTFIDKGITKVINIEDNETRYDAGIKDHGHFKCIKCKKIYDFTINIDELNIPELNQFQINEKDVYIKGICNNCLN